MSTLCKQLSKNRKGPHFKEPDNHKIHHLYQEILFHIKEIILLKEVKAVKKNQDQQN